MNNNIARKIRALLDKAESTSFDEERQAFIAKATALMVQHNIDQATVDANGQKVNRGSVGIRYLQGQAKGPYGAVRHMLAGAACEATGAETWRDSGDIVIVGFEDQLDMTETLYTSLLLQATSGAESSYKPDYGHRMSYNRSFILSFARTVWQRIEDSVTAATEEAEERAPGSALVLLDSAEAINSFKEDMGIRTRKANISGASSFAGSRNGHAAGTTADIGNKRVGGARAALV